MLEDKKYTKNITQNLANVNLGSENISIDIGEISMREEIRLNWLRVRVKCNIGHL